MRKKYWRRCFRHAAMTQAASVAAVVASTINKNIQGTTTLTLWTTIHASHVKRKAYRMRPLPAPVSCVSTPTIRGGLFFNYGES